MKESYQAAAFLFMFLLTCEAVTWAIVAPENGVARVASVFLGFIVFGIAILLVWIAVQDDLRRHLRGL